MSRLGLWLFSVARSSYLPRDLPDFKVTVVFILYCSVWFKNYMTRWNAWSCLILWNSHKTNEDNYLMTYNLFVCRCNRSVSVSVRQTQRKYVIIGFCWSRECTDFFPYLCLELVSCANCTADLGVKCFKYNQWLFESQPPPQLCFM